MFAEWIIGLLAGLVATPVAVASYVSARRASAAERPPQPVRVLRHAPAAARAPAAHHRRSYRHVAA
jgi:hypothetical protein